MNITIFEEQKNDEIIFNNINTEDIFQAFQLFVNYNILNIPLNINGRIKANRKVSELENIEHKKLDYIILNADCCSKENLNSIINYFKMHNLKVIIGGNTKFDNKQNFGFKGIIKTQEYPIRHINSLYKLLENDLKNYCSLNKQFYRTGNFTFKIGLSNIIYRNDYGKPLDFGDITLSDIRIKVDIDKTLKFEKNTKILDFCKEAFKLYGFVLESKGAGNNPDIYKKEFINDDGEIDYEYGYYYYESSPYIMFHEKYYKSCDIFNSVKKQEMKIIDLEGKLHYNGYILEEPIFKAKINGAIEKNLKKFISGDGNNLITIKGPMGSGKSKLIRQIIDVLIEEGLRILIITNRVSLAEEFEDLYKIMSYKYQRDIIKLKSDINKLKSQLKVNSVHNVFINNKINEIKSQIEKISKIKNEVTKELGIRAKSLICQFESLKNYNKDDFDIILIDECISTLLYTRSYNDQQAINDYKENLKILYNCLLEKKVILADAFLNKYFIDIFKKKSNFIFNIKDEIKDTSQLVSCETIQTFYYLISKAVLNKMKFSVSCISDSELKFICNFIKKINPHIRIMVFTSKTSLEERKQIFEAIRQDTAPYDVFVYSPSLTVGVSILNKDVTRHFHYDCSRAIDPISSIQMLRRNRYATHFYYFVRNLEIPLCNDENTLILRACNPGGMKYGVNTNVHKSENIELSNLVDVQNNYQNRILCPRVYTYAGVNKNAPTLNALSKEGLLQIKIDKFLNTICRNQKVSFECFLELNFSNKPQRIKYDFDLEIFKKILKN